ncbi:hypothetical protein M9H77_09734 [Catharanthus roseus]|uniref:Uncharacterized protein n=1 Tax=Catharanthus roseus TaxID=4058 RepID=A0ACC0C1F0_CATRO|nr:hypothetical protein M9H77_09734 [Catharanthus roseus]
MEGNKCALGGLFKWLRRQTSSLVWLANTVLNRVSLGKKIEKYHTGKVYLDPTLDPRGSGLGLEFYTLEGMGPGLGPSLTIRVRVWVWGYSEGLDPFIALHIVYEILPYHPTSGLIMPRQIKRQPEKGAVSDGWGSGHLTRSRGQTNNRGGGVLGGAPTHAGWEGHSAAVKDESATVARVTRVTKSYYVPVPLYTKLGLPSLSIK